MPTKARKKYIIWGNCNIYATARIGEGCSIGFGSEIGNHVRIGRNTRIGYGCFIPELVEIHENCFIGPATTFTNDRYMSGPKSAWERTVVKAGAKIGAGCVILCGLTIGRNAIVGAGSVVTKDVPASEIHAGNPAKRIGRV